MAIFGKNTARPFKDLTNVIKKIYITAETLGSYWSKLYTTSNKTIQNNLMEKIHDYGKIIWAGYEDDPTEKELEEIIENIENICKPILQGK